MELKKNQQIILEKLLVTSKDILDKTNANNILYFSAPTGSGKTFILSNLIREIIDFFKNEKIVFFFASLSDGDIYKQIYDGFNKYSELKRWNIKNDLIDNSDVKLSNSTIKDLKQSFISNKFKMSNISNHHVFFMGTKQFTSGSILYKNEVLSKCIENLKENNYKIVYIRDEAHIGEGSINSVLNLKESKNLNKLFSNKCDLNIQMSATLNSSIHKNIVDFSYEMAIEDKLIKNNIQVHDGIINKHVYDNTNFSKLCIDTFISKPQTIYKESKFNINPALLIQVSNTDYNNELKWYSDLRELVSQLKENNLKYYIWLDDNNKLDENNIPKTNYDPFSFLRKDEIRNFLSKDDCGVDVIIFKLAIATGWDIPRACMLLQLRNLTSENLNTQVLGRIKRNPLLKYEFADEEYNSFSTCWFYSNIDISPLKIKKVEIKDKFKNEEFMVPSIRSHINEIDWDKYKYCISQKLIQIIENNYIQPEFNIKINTFKSKNIINNKYNDCNSKKAIQTNKVDNQFCVYFNFIDQIKRKKIPKLNIDNLFKIIEDICILKLTKTHYLMQWFNENISEFSIFVEEYNKLLNFNYNEIYQSFSKKKLPIFSSVELVTKDVSEWNSRQSINISNREVSKTWSYVEDTCNKNILDILKNANDVQLDSWGEILIVKLVNEVIKIKEENNEFKLSLFTKHYLSGSTIKFPYIYDSNNEVKTIKNSFPDFLMTIKNINNNNDVKIILEVKSAKDYNNQKTGDIKEMFKFLSNEISYKDYFFIISIFDTEKSMNKFTLFHRGNELDVITLTGINKKINIDNEKVCSTEKILEFRKNIIKILRDHKNV